MSKTKELAIDVQNTLRELEHLCIHHDWHYAETTDKDTSAADIGRAEHGKIVGIIIDCRSKGAGLEAQSIYNSYAPSSYLYEFNFNSQL